ncbi:MAG TPA: CDGSH iron-sulfur domain-containing protein [Gemmatimonadaceae bacterium]|nr:CDGSH iron-sulfur domain-containing protein [Gemmatimonadaceae bacterium]
MSVKITVRKDGPYRVEGEFQLFDADGNQIPIEIPPGKEGKPISLCRCGASSRKPFCDGTHSKIGFDAAERAVERSESDG